MMSSRRTLYQVKATISSFIENVKRTSAGHTPTAAIDVDGFDLTKSREKSLMIRTVFTVERGMYSEEEAARRLETRRSWMELIW